MPTSRRRVFYRRRFLNPAHHHAGAYVIAEVETVIRGGKRRDGSAWHEDAVYVTLTLSDCSRVIDLCFDSDDAAERRASLHKINLLVDTLTRVRDAMETEYAALAARERERRAAGRTGRRTSA
jgi:hypothetical protein